MTAKTAQHKVERHCCEVIWQGGGEGGIVVKSSGGGGGGGGGVPTTLQSYG